MTFNEEQNVLQKTIVKLSIFAHQNMMQKVIYDSPKEISNDEVHVISGVSAVLTDTRDELVSELKELLKQVVVILESEGKLRGGYYYANRNKSLHTCLFCNKSFVPSSSKAKYCSNACRVAQHRQK